MKKLLVLTILAAINFHQLSYSQRNETIKFNTNDLLGVWDLKSNLKNDNLIFEKRAVTEHKYGSSIEFLKNGEFYHRYSAPCGNDRKKYTDNYNGKWDLNKEEWIIITNTKSNNQKGSIYKILKLQSDKLILEEIKEDNDN